MSYGLTRSDLERYVARFLGYSSTLNTKQQQDVDDAVESGYRRFLDPPPTEQGQLAHQWSFLHEIGTLTLTEGDWEYPAPANFQTMNGTFTFSSPSDLARAAMVQVPENDLRRLRQKNMPEWKWPHYFSLRYAADSLVMFQFYPTPTGADYDVEYKYAVKKSLGDTPILGGDVHAETILSACLAAAERLMEESLGVHEGIFQERIRTSIDNDKRNSPNFYGYNGNRRENCDYMYKSINITHENES